MMLIPFRKTVEDLVRRYREAGYFPDACVTVFDRDHTIMTICAGRADEDSLFDVASLTKIVTGTQILRLAEQGKLRMQDPVLSYLPELAANAYLKVRMRGITLSMLMTHTSTLPAWYPFYSRCGESFAETLAYALAHTEKTSGVVYSDLNFMILGKLLETMHQKPLERCLKEELVDPLGLGSMMYCPKGKTNVIPSDYGNAIEMRMCRERQIEFEGFRPLGVPVVGTVNDGNSHYYFGDVAGHAGVFATSESYARLCRYYMTSDSGWILQAQKEQPESPGRGLGLQTGLTYPYGCGHTGFTGTSIYFSREKNIGCVAFTNRLFFQDGSTHDMSEFRCALHEIVFALGTLNAGGAEN